MNSPNQPLQRYRSDVLRSFYFDTTSAIGKKPSRSQGPISAPSESTYRDLESTTAHINPVSSDPQNKKPGRLKLSDYGTFPWNFRPTTTRPPKSTHATDMSSKPKTHDQVPLLGDDEEGQNDTNSGTHSLHADDSLLEHDAFCKLIGMNPNAGTGSGSADLEAGAGLYHDVHRSYINALR
ncbi:hypothetical protein EJ03DRAFT_78338 [Teratosphaeria nubilosa]|uniref:Uncharacterized protein n=1 Tax=Teratosphaeria nubilosa TaxID=161662 RepID=A0A6G1LCH3_9PEZI|nr:hypothetical protein EJ03DRAFT_78338 [Teratosphaeria nubilosa]